jgi:hypothetical protein
MRLLSVTAIAILMLGPVLARAQDTAVETETANPSTPAPKKKPPPPPAKVPPPPQAQPFQVEAPQAQATPPGPVVQSLVDGKWVQTTGAPVAVAPPRAGGQWVYTDQYGWVWIPYGSQYTYSPTIAGASPYQYVYYPSVGWSWLLAPWVFGWGVNPYFGVYGTTHFAWYGSRHYGGYGYYGRGYYPGYGGNRYYPGGSYYGGYRPAYGGYGYRPAYGGYGYRSGYGGYGYRPGFGTGVQTWHGSPPPVYGGGQSWRGSPAPVYGGAQGWRGSPGTMAPARSFSAPPSMMQGRPGGFGGGAPHGGGWNGGRR